MSNDRTPPRDNKITASQVCPPAPRKLGKLHGRKRKRQEFEFFEVLGRAEIELFFQSTSLVISNGASWHGSVKKRIMAISTFSKLLEEYKLTGPNYVDWKRNLFILLTAEKLANVAKGPKPPHPPAEATAEDMSRYEQWFEKDELAKCYILASIDSSLQKQYESMTYSHEILLSLAEAFEEQNRPARMNALSNLMSCKMTEGTSVHAHANKMIGYLNELESLGSEWDAETKVDFIIASLPPSFKDIKMQFALHPPSVTLSELSNMLKRAEDVMKKDQALVMVTERAGPSKKKGKKSSFKSNGKGKGKGQAFKKKGKKDQSGDICNFCGKKGHWKRNCRSYLASKEKPSEGVQGKEKTQ